MNKKNFFGFQADDDDWDDEDIDDDEEFDE